MWFPFFLRRCALRRRFSGSFAAAALWMACCTAAHAAVQCAALNGWTIPAAAIGLPTGGASIESATVVYATSETPEYCKVLGAIWPVNPASTEINFQVNLPTVWNQRSMQFGGGGFDGQPVTGLKNVPHALSDSLTPLQRGYATFGSDSGHSGTILDGSFATDEEALRNYAGDAIKKVRDVAQQLMVQRYGQTPWKSYIAGLSKGGQEALVAVQRWPNDYDGALVSYPALLFTASFLQGNRIARAQYAPGAFVNSSKMNNLAKNVMDACDALDGNSDGLISNVAACHYDPAAMRCMYNVDWGNHCLTDAQINTVRAYDSRIELSFPLANGITGAPGFNILAGANFNGPLDVGWWSEPLNPAVIGLNGFLFLASDEWLKYFVTGDANYDSLQFTPETGGAWQGRLLQLSGWLDATTLNLTPFMQRGGKLLLLHGTSDTIVSPRNSIEYVQRLQQQYGVEGLRQFMRFYMVPGFGHGDGSFIAGWNSLDLIQAWVENNQPPSNLVVKDVINVFGRTRPLCEYPTWPRYNGGPSTSAASYSCTTQ